MYSSLRHEKPPPPSASSPQPRRLKRFEGRKEEASGRIPHPALLSWTQKTRPRGGEHVGPPIRSPAHGNTLRRTNTHAGFAIRSHGDPVAAKHSLRPSAAFSLRWASTWHASIPHLYMLYVWNTRITQVSKPQPVSLRNDYSHSWVGWIACHSVSDSMSLTQPTTPALRIYNMITYP